MKAFRQFVAATALAVCAPAQAGIDAAPLPEPDEVYPGPVDWSGLGVLHVGDSHVSAGLTSTLRTLLRDAKARYYPYAWIGSRSKSWVVSGRLSSLIGELRPDVVIVTLGTNGMSGGNPRKGAYWIRLLVQRIGPRRCYWLGPPPLIEDRYGFNEAAASSCSPCRYFDTRPLGFPPRADGRFHLTRGQGEEWARSVWKWMNGAV